MGLLIWVFFQSSNIKVSISTPESGALSGDSLAISAGITSIYELISVTAAVKNRTVNLTSSNGYYFVGSINLAGLARYQKTLVIIATDYIGGKDTGYVNFIYDKKPVLNVQYPKQNLVLAQPTIHIKATATDDDSSYGANIFVDVNNNTTIINTTNSVDKIVDLSAYVGEKIELEI